MHLGAWLLLFSLLAYAENTVQGKLLGLVSQGLDNQQDPEKKTHIHWSAFCVNVYIKMVFLLFLFVWPWTISLTVLSFNFLIRKIEKCHYFYFYNYSEVQLRCLCIKSCAKVRCNYCSVTELKMYWL